MPNNEDKQPFSGSAGYSQSYTRPVYQKPARYAVGVQAGGRQGGYFIYTGQNLVNRRNQIERQPYDITDDFVRFTYSQMSPTDRADAFNTLKKYGFYGSTDPGIFNNDINAITRWLDYSNTIGVTADRALDEMKRQMQPVSTGGGAARRYRVSNPDDLRTVLNKAALDTIGRAFTEQELNLAIPGYQKAEMQAQQSFYAGGVSVEAPSATTFGQQAAQFLAPTEANGQKFLRMMDAIFGATEGM